MTDPQEKENPPPVSPTTTTAQPILPESLAVRYKIESEIGRGSFAKAYLVRENASEGVYVAKVMNTTTMTPKDREHVKSEMSCLEKCDHMNIVRHKETVVCGNQIVLIVEYADGGDLAKQIRLRNSRKIKFAQQEIAILATQLLLAVQHVHSLGILHRDIKPANIFLTQMGLVKLGDFGFSKQYDDTISSAVGNTICGTPFYISPEMWKGQKYNKASDVWALGVVLYEMMTLQRPFKGDTMKEVSQEILKGDHAPIPPGSYSADLIAICNAMMLMDPARRPSISELLSQPVFQKALKTIQEIVAHPAYGKDSQRVPAATPSA
eukprot:PhF_6_TR22549/c2_g1_i3/m.32064/K08857/NEK1_4_5; NIMA (never in mitosis gene a)-related kinase 1/4/5